MEQIKRHYYTTHDFLNPSRIVPDGPAIDFGAPPGRRAGRRRRSPGRGGTGAARGAIAALTPSPVCGSRCCAFLPQTLFLGASCARASARLVVRRRRPVLSTRPGRNLEPRGQGHAEACPTADAKVIGDLYPYKDTATYRRVPAEPLDRTAILSEIAGMAHERRRARRQGHRLGQPLLRRPRPLPLPGRGLRPVLARQRAAARHVPERHQVRGRDHRHGERPAARHGDRRRHGRRHREPDHRPVLPTASSPAPGAASQSPTSSCR